MNQSTNAGVHRAPTARSTAPKTRTTAAHLTARHRTTTTGTTSGTGTTNGDNGRGGNTAKRTRGPHEAPLSVSSGRSGTAMETHSQLSAPPEAHDPPLESLPSGLDVSANHNPMDLDKDPLQDSFQRVLQVAADAHQ